MENSVHIDDQIRLSLLDLDVDSKLEVETFNFIVEKAKKRNMGIKSLLHKMFSVKK